MKNRIFSILSWMILLMVFNIGHAVAATYAWKNHDLDIFTSSPPALIYVQDSKNNVTGADPTKGLNSYGEGSVIQNIPESFVEQDNLGSDAINGVSVPNATTGWSINLTDQPTENLIVNLVGVSTGVTELWITGLYSVGLKIPKVRNNLDIFMTDGVTRQIQVTFNPTSESLTTIPTISSGSFLQDTQFACSYISPPEACEALEDLAAEVEKSITKGDSSKETTELNLYLFVLNLLHNWGGPESIQNWGGLAGCSECVPLFKKGTNGAIFFAKDPAYSALQLDAETLLNALPNGGTSR